MPARGDGVENELSEAYEIDLNDEQAIFDRMTAQDTAEIPECPVDLPINKGGRPFKVVPIKLVAWRQAHKASIRETAKRWCVSEASVKRMSRDYGEAAIQERKRWEGERLDTELRYAQNGYWQMYNRMHSERLYWVGLSWFPKCEAARGTEQATAIEAARDVALADACRDFRTEWERAMGPIPEYASHW